MPDQVTNYQCLACGGPLHFDGALGKLKCDYCGSAFTTAEVEAFYAAKDASAAQAQAQADAQQRQQQTNAQQQANAQNAQAQANAQAGAASSDWDMSDLQGNGGWGADAAGMKTYNCPSCGAQLICDATTAATECPYCGNPSIVPGQFVNDLRPDYVIPFRLDKEAAKRALLEHYKGKPLLPGAFKTANHVNKIQGVYVPFWLFDGRAEGGATFEATRSHTHRQGDDEITETEHFTVVRAGSLDFQGVPVDGSSKMDDDYMDSIEPFDYSALTRFSTAYLPGFLADKYDVGVEACARRADERCANTFVDELRGTVVGYDTCVEMGRDVRLLRGKVHYALMPVWVLNTKWNGKDYMFMMNGQTGKMVGDLPTSQAKFWGLFFAIAVGLMIVLTLIGV